jgi:type IV secretory pathway protease TraF
VTRACHCGLILIALTAALLLAIASLNMLHIAGNLSPSAPRGFYRITHEPLQRSTYVIRVQRVLKRRPRVMLRPLMTKRLS